MEQKKNMKRLHLEINKNKLKDLNWKGIHISSESNKRRLAGADDSSDSGGSHRKPIRNIHFFKFLTNKFASFIFLKSKFRVSMDFSSHWFYPFNMLCFLGNSQNLVWTFFCPNRTIWWSKKIDFWCSWLVMKVYNCGVFQ